MTDKKPEYSDIASNMMDDIKEKIAASRFKQIEQTAIELSGGDVIHTEMIQESCEAHGVDLDRVFG